MPDFLSDPELLTLWYTASREQVGVCILTSDVERLRGRLYKVRSEEMNPELSGLLLAPDPDRPTTHLWIVHKIVKVNDDAQEG